MILHSHGWGGSRSTTGFTDWLDAGFAVLSFDQRGFGQSGRRSGQFEATANVQDPDFEARDVVALIDMVAELDWVATDAPGDPVLGAIGGSYGGGYQWVTALYETETTGATRFDAIAPEISWYDLPDALAPSGVARTTWLAALYAAGSYALPEYVHQAFAYGSATGQWPDGTVPEPAVPNLDAEFHEHGPVGFVDRGIQLDVPALIRQGASDNLFNLNQGLKNFANTLTDGARADSLFVGYNGGHALPNVLPAGSASGADPCSDASASGGWTQLTMDFYRAAFAGGDTTALLPEQYNFATMDGDCLAVEALDEVLIDLPGSLTVTTSGAGAPQHVELADGPLTVSGIPTLDADVTSIGADQRIFLALSVGTSPLDATVVQNNVLPLHELLPVVGERREGIELPGVAVELAEGEKLFLTVSPVSDMFPGHGSVRTPGAVLLENLTMHLPVPGTADDGGDTGGEDPCAGLSGRELGQCRKGGKGGGDGTNPPAPASTWTRMYTYDRARVR
jgi:pimeloyl-ACP methyl ester carboxylesterase